MDWDPLSNAVQGLDWPVIREGGTRLDSAVRSAGVLVPSTATETVTAVSVYMADVVGDATYNLSVYEAADLPVGSATTSTYRPNEDGPSIANITGVPVNTVGSRYTNLDETVLSTTDYVTSATGLGVWDVRANLAAGIGSGAQIVYVVRVCAVLEVPGGPTAFNTFSGYVNLSGTRYDAGGTTVQASDGRHQVDWEFPVNPLTNSPWTVAEIQALDTTDEFGVAMISPSPTGGSRIYQMWLEVDHTADIRVGTASQAISETGWATFTLDASWSKLTATDYIAVIRRTAGSGSLTVVSLDSGDTMPGGHGAYQPAIDRVGIIATLGDLRTEAHPFVMTVGGAASADSQPYASRGSALVHTGQSAIQEITAGSTAARRWVRVVARSQTIDVPTAPLVLTLSAQTCSFAAALIADAPMVWHVLDGVLGGDASLTSAVQYDLTASCTAASGAGWEVAYLDTLTPPVSADTAGFGGTTDRGEVNGGGEANSVDLAVVYGTVPTAPAGFTATGAANVVNLAWTATALGGSFAGYVIERRAPDGVTWQTIATESTEATATYVDRGARLTVAEHYRISVRHTNGTISIPSTSDDGTATGTVPLLVCIETGTSIELAEVQYQAKVAFPRDRVVSARMGRRFPSVVESPYDRGASVSSTLAIVPAVADQGWVQGWDDLRAFLDAGAAANAASYVLLTDFGERMWVWPVVDGGDLVFQTMLQLPFTFVQVADTPTVHVT
jgi:hypothetical protein